MSDSRLGSPVDRSPRFDETTLLHNVLLFSRLLRRSGLTVSLDQTLGFVQALRWVEVGDRQQVYHAARSFLVNRYEDLRLFEILFGHYWSRPAERPGPRAQKAPLAPRHKRERPQRPAFVRYLADSARATDPEIDVLDRLGTYSAEEALQAKDFAHMTVEELAEVRRLIQEMRWQVPLRQSRRLVADRRGSRIDLRRALREAAKHDGVPLELAYRSRKIKERPVILLADISGSMEKFSRLVLQLFYSVTQSLRQVECFVFGTRLSRITTELRMRNIDRALDEASRRVIDWSGGTRIGDSLATFNERWGRRLLRRGCVVLIVSDGWERGDVELLRRQIRHLQYRCHRLIWLNPHVGHAEYQPLVEGMSAALPYIDDFLPIHNMHSLRDLAMRLSSMSIQKRSVAPAWRRALEG